MNLSEFSFMELNKLYWQLGIEYLKRTWIVWLIIIVLVVVLSIPIKIYFNKKNY